MQGGERWVLALSSIWGLGLTRSAKAVQPETYKIEKSNAVIVRAAGPYGPKGEIGPDQLTFNPRSGELTVTPKGSHAARKGKCDLEPLPRLQIQPQSH